MLGKDSPHCQNPAPCLPVAQKIERKTQSTEHSFVLDDSPRLQQVHRSLSLRLDQESFGYEKTLPLHNRQRPSAVMNGVGEVILNLLLGAFGEVVGDQAKFMDAVTSTGLQQPVCLSNNTRLLLGRLHGEHRFAIDDR